MVVIHWDQQNNTYPHFHSDLSEKVQVPCWSLCVKSSLYVKSEIQSQNKNSNICWRFINYFILRYNDEGFENIPEINQYNEEDPALEEGSEGFDEDPQEYNQGPQGYNSQGPQGYNSQGPQGYSNEGQQGFNEGYHGEGESDERFGQDAGHKEYGFEGPPQGYAGNQGSQGYDQEEHYGQEDGQDGENEEYRQDGHTQGVPSYGQDNGPQSYGQDSGPQGYNTDESQGYGPEGPQKEYGFEGPPQNPAGGQAGYESEGLHDDFNSFFHEERKQEVDEYTVNFEAEGIQANSLFGGGREGGKEGGGERAGDGGVEGAEQHQAGVQPQFDYDYNKYSTLHYDYEYDGGSNPRDEAPSQNLSPQYQPPPSPQGYRGQARSSGTFEDIFNPGQGKNKGPQPGFAFW